MIISSVDRSMDYLNTNYHSENQLSTYTHVLIRIFNTLYFRYKDDLGSVPPTGYSTPDLLQYYGGFTVVQFVYR